MKKLLLAFLFITVAFTTSSDTEDENIKKLSTFLI